MRNENAGRQIGSDPLAAANRANPSIFLLITPQKEAFVNNEKTIFPIKNKVIKTFLVVLYKNKPAFLIL